MVVLFSFSGRIRSLRSPFNYARFIACLLAGLVMLALYTMGFVAEIYIDALVQGSLTSTLGDWRIRENLLGFGITLSIAAYEALVPAIAGTFGLFVSGGRFWPSVFMAAASSFVALVIRFYVVFWNVTVPGSPELMFGIAIIGTIFTSIFAIGEAFEFEGTLLPRIEGRPGRTALVTTGLTFAIFLGCFVAYIGGYYIFIFIFKENVELKFKDWDSIAVKGTMESAIHPGLFGNEDGYLPALPFYDNELDEEAIGDARTHIFPKPVSVMRFSFARIINPTESMNVSGLLVGTSNAHKREAFAPLRLNVLPFIGCTPRELARAWPALRASRTGSTLTTDQFESFTVESYRVKVIQSPGVSDNVTINLPAWNESWIHLMKHKGGVSVSQVFPLKTTTRAMLRAPKAMSLIILTDALAPQNGSVSIHRSGRTTQSDDTFAKTVWRCAEPLSGNGAEGSPIYDDEATTAVPWKSWYQNDRIGISGYLLFVHPDPQASPAKPTSDDSEVVMRMEDANLPARMIESIALPLSESEMIDDIVGGVNAHSLQVANERGAVEASGSFGPKQFASSQFQVIDAAGENLKIKTDPAIRAGGEISGTAVAVSWDSRYYEFTLPGLLKPEFVFAMLGAAASAVFSLLIVIFKRTGRYDRLWTLSARATPSLAHVSAVAVQSEIKELDGDQPTAGGS
jgi:hypothetical protein